MSLRVPIYRDEAILDIIKLPRPDWSRRGNDRYSSVDVDTRSRPLVGLDIFTDLF